MNLTAELTHYAANARARIAICGHELLHHRAAAHETHNHAEGIAEKMLVLTASQATRFVDDWRI